MFTACPHCQFLVARDPQTGALPAACPRCGTSLAVDDIAGATRAPSLATFLHPAPSSAPALEDATDPQAHAHADTPRHEMPDQVADSAPDALDTDETTPGPAPSAAAAPVSLEVIETIDATTTDAAAQPSDQDDAPVAVHADAPSHGDEPIDAAPVAAIVEAPPKARGPAGPRFLQRTRTTPVHARHARAQWIAVVALSLLLCVQALLADRARLATQAGWRPIVVALCGVFRCDVPTWREPAAFTMLSRDVRPIIGRPGTLQAQATFRNEARWAQAWPVILLTLKDADGRTLGARALAPGDYLPQGEASPSIGPGQSAQMAVLVKEPSANVVAFSFDFR